MTATKANPTTNRKYEIEDYQEIPLSSVLYNPLNPRPSFHCEDDDPELLALADSIGAEGQHRPIAIYELKGHYEYADQPGMFMLLQGERRTRACHIAEVELVRANIHRVPATRAEELELLSVEDGHRLSWQPFFEMQHAFNLSLEYGIPVRHPNIQAKTGLSMEQLRTAEKVFSLEAEIQQMVAEYEREMHTQRLSGRRKKNGRLAGSGVRTKEFTPVKAAMVYDIFDALRTNLTLTVKEYTDVDLQRRIAAWSTHGANIDDLNNILQSIRQAGEAPPPGLIAKVHTMIQNPETGVRGIVKTMGNSHLQRLSDAGKRIEKSGRDAATLTRKADNFGYDIQVLEQIRAQLIAAVRDIDRLERAISDRIRTVERRGN